MAVASVDAVKVKKDTDVDVEKVHTDRGSETGTVSAAAAVAVASVDAVKVKVGADLGKSQKGRGLESGATVIDTGLVKANLRKVQRETGTETDTEAETNLDSVKANLRKVQREMGAGSDAGSQTEAVTRIDLDVETVHAETGSGTRKVDSGTQGKTDDHLVSDLRQRESERSESRTPGYSRAKVSSGGYDAATLALLASLRIRGTSDADIAELLKLHQLQRRAEWSKSPSPGDLSPEYATLEELAKRQTDVNAVVACLAEYDESTAPEQTSVSKAHTRPGLPLGPHRLDIDAAQGQLTGTLAVSKSSNLSFRDEIPEELIVAEPEEPLRPRIPAQVNADSADDQGRLGMRVGRDLPPGLSGRLQSGSGVPGTGHAIGIAEGGVAETRSESSAIDLNIREKVESKGIRYPEVEKVVAHKAEKDIFVRNWDDESYKLLSSGMEIESENSSVNPLISSKAVSSQRLSSEAESISTKSSARTGENSPSNWDEDGNRRFGRGMFRGTGDCDDSDEVVMFGVDRTHSHSIRRDLGQGLEDSNKKLARGMFRATGDATTGEDNEVVMFGVDRTHSLSIRRDLGQGQGTNTNTNGNGKVFVENFDHGAYERCGSGIFREKVSSGTSSPNSRDDKSDRRVPSLMMPSTASSSLTNSAAPSPMSPNYANSFSSKAIFTSQIVNNRKATPRGDEESLASSLNSLKVNAQTAKPPKRSKPGATLLSTPILSSAP